ncbi:molybdenum cofactor guanylyltransferase MobA [Sneathiella glossodoripedis]|uniref:molybdenum cofactor guanylyltransferase MobA n=1 Tax=Sneathiella glossodoripedis TaxID=418853 RepID=UPI00047095F3|nr:molybdenum cofactor guanylyltransferase MobA [Sneathiella glossodoripedis]
MSNHAKPPCVILAGGLSRRMGGEHKFLKPLGRKSLLEHVIDAVKPQVSDILINSNTNIDETRYPVRADSFAGNLGPLCGILTGLEYFSEIGTEATHMLCVPSDAPFIPLDLVDRLSDVLSGSSYSIAMAYSNHRIHPVVSLWPFSLLDDLRNALEQEDLRKILVFAERYSLRSAEWEAGDLDPFFNINRPEDLVAADALQRSEKK